MLISEPAAESKFLAIMHRKLFRFWLNYWCPGKWSNTSVGPMLMACGAADAPLWVSEGLKGPGTNPKAWRHIVPARRDEPYCWPRASSSPVRRRGSI